MSHRAAIGVWQYIIYCLAHDYPCPYSGDAYRYGHVSATANSHIFSNSNAARHRSAPGGRSYHDAGWAGDIGSFTHGAPCQHANISGHSTASYRYPNSDRST